MRCRVPILLCALLVCSAALGAVPAAGQQQVDGTHLEVQLQTDGDAAWNVTVRMPIADEREREEFEAFASDFEAGESSFDLGAGAFERAATEASAASGREMSVTSVQRDSEVLNATESEEPGKQYGVLRLSFTWEGFARVGEDGTIYVDDAFNTTDGTWLPGLGPNQSLTIRSPPGYGGPSTSPIGAEEGDLRWEGPTTFEPGYFSIVYPPTSTGPTEPAEDGLSTVLVGGAVVLSAAALLLGVYLLFARGRGDAEQGDEQPASDRPSQIVEQPDATVGDTSDPTESLPAGADDTAGASDADPPTDDEEPDFELLSDEERVEYLLEQNGGRMKQATIVKETGWSNAKVSQLLSSMDEEDRVDKLRIGRENLISLPEEGVSDIEGNSSGS